MVTFLLISWLGVVAVSYLGSVMVLKKVELL